MTITPAEFQKAMQPRIINAWKKYGDGDIRKFAYIQATRKLETGGRYEPIPEYWGPSAAQRGYEGRADLGNNQPGDGSKFRGRGDVQTTGRLNYQRYKDLLGVDLIANPDLALDPQVSAFICVHGMMNGIFTTRKLSRYINSSKCDFYNARHVVNGEDKASLIAGYAEEFLAYLQANPQLLETHEPPPITAITTTITAIAKKKHVGLYVGIAATLIFAGVGAVFIMRSK